MFTAIVPCHHVFDLERSSIEIIPKIGICRETEVSLSHTHAYRLRKRSCLLPLTRAYVLITTVHNPFVYALRLQFNLAERNKPGPRSYVSGSEVDSIADTSQASGGGALSAAETKLKQVRAAIRVLEARAIDRIAAGVARDTDEDNAQIATLSERLAGINAQLMEHETVLDEGSTDLARLSAELLASETARAATASEIDEFCSASIALNQKNRRLKSKIRRQEKEQKRAVDATHAERTRVDDNERIVADVDKAIQCYLRAEQFRSGADSARKTNQQMIRGGRSILMELSKMESELDASIASDITAITRLMEEASVQRVPLGLTELCSQRGL